MVGLNEIIGTTSDTMIGSAIAIFTLFILLFIIYISWLTITRWRTFNHWVIIFSQTKAGIQKERVKGGWIKTKEGKREFQTLKPKFVINTFNPEWIVPPKRKKLITKPEVYAFHYKDNTIIQLEPECINKDGNKINFIPRQLGRDRFEEAFQKSTAEFWDFRSWIEKNKETILFGGAFMTLLMFNFILLLKVIG